VETDYPYLASIKNLPAILAKIKDAGTPPRFGSEFLKQHLGFPSSNDRTIVGVLKRLGFLTPDGTPTDRYNAFRGDDKKSGLAMAEGLREGWADIFLADQKANTRSASELKQLFKSVTGKGDAVAEKMATTFKALAVAADWSPAQPAAPTGPHEEQSPAPPAPPASKPARQHQPAGTELLLRHDVHVHLPATSDVAVYTAIFRALKDELLD
jgi:hypothetical protein